MAPSSSLNISQMMTQLLKKTSHYDKDERYMATSDLCELLKKQQSTMEISNGNSNSSTSTTSSSVSSTYNSKSNGLQPYMMIDASLEKEICTTVLRLLHDKSNDVQAIAVKTLGVLITTIQNGNQLIEISNSLLDQIVDRTKLELRDIYTAGLRTVIQTCSYSMGTPITQSLIVRLIDTIRTVTVTGTTATTTTSTVTKKSNTTSPPPPSTSTTTTTTAATTTTTTQQQNDEMIISCCDVIMDCIVRFGNTSIYMIQNHEAILQISLQLLLSSSSASASSSLSTTTTSSSSSSSSSTMMVRKRTGLVLACLATVLNDTLLHKLIEELLHPIELQQQQQQQSSEASNTTTTTNNNNNVDTRTLIRTMCSISGSVGHRFQQYHIDRIVPIFLQFTNPRYAITGDDDDDNHHNENDEDMTGADNPITDQQMDGEGYNGGVSTAAAAGAANTGLVMNELREACFIGYASFIVCCPNEMEHHLPTIIAAALAYMKYDPNYSYGTTTTTTTTNDGNDDEEDEEQEDMEEYENDDDDEYDEDDDDEDDEDDDESWKVRRSAIRTLKAIIEMKLRSNGNATNGTNHQQQHIGSLWTNVYPTRTTTTTTTTTISKSLMERFIEREENCRVDIIDCFTKLLAITIQHVTLAAAAANNSNSGSNQDSTTTATTGLQFMSSNTSSSSDAMMMATDSSSTTTCVIIPLQTEYTPIIVKSCATILSKFKKSSSTTTTSHGNNTNDRSKSAALALLSTLCTVPGSGVGNYNEIQIITQQIQLLLGGGSTTTGSTPVTVGINVSKALRLDALSLLHAMLASDTHNPMHIRQSLTEPLLKQLCATVVQEQWYKVISEALRAISQIPRYFVIGYDSTTSSSPGDIEKERTVVANELYIALEPLLAAHDVDSEIKEGALRACSTLLQYLHLNLTTDQTNRLLQLLYDRLTNETTRIAAMKAYATIAQPLPPTDAMTTVATPTTSCQLHCILDDSISSMAMFLKLQNRSLKQSSLETLNVVISNHGQNVTNPKELYPVVVNALSLLISGRDLHLCHLSLRVLASILQEVSTVEIEIMQYVLEPVLLLSTSSLLQDPALDSLLSLLKQMMISNAIDFSELYGLLQAKLSTQIGKHGIYNLSKCIAVITANSSAECKQSVLQNIISLLDGSTTPTDAMDVAKIQLSLLVTGDVGRMLSLLTISDSGAQLQDIYVGYFESPSEEVKTAAAYALGNAAVGSSESFLQTIVTQLDTGDKKHTYLLLSALREFIIHRSRNVDSCEVMVANVSMIVPVLGRYCSDEDEGVRTMVAECLGALTCQQPEVLLPMLENRLHTLLSATDTGDDKENAFVSSTVASTIKLAIAGKVNAALLAVSMPTFVKLLHHKDVTVRHASLLMIYSAVHHMPIVISTLMKDDIMSSLYELAKLKLERKVDLGPFTHTVDDALPLRKAALSIFSTCMENVPGSVDASEFIIVLVKALGDAEDIQLHAHQILISMCNRQPTYIITALDSFVEPLEKTMNKKPGDKTGTELDRLNDWIKSALRAMVTMSKLEGCMNSRKFADFCERIKSNSKFTALLAGIED